jgi:ABC-type multidrug transport system ATPase subunit
LGQLTALMGPSGAGKSTLLRCITDGRNHAGFDGRIFIEGQEDVRAVFITQHAQDHLLFNLTVDESLWYASEMKNPPGTPRAKHRVIVDGLVGDLNLAAVKGRLVEVISGGEMKRLTIGMELTSELKPNFLFLDEPTSGLDSCAGLMVRNRGC